MKEIAPKGSYHHYCRSNITSQIPNTHRVRSVPSNRIVKQPPPIQQFQQFETYLRFLQQKERQEAQQSQRPKTTDYRSPITSRPTTRNNIIRQSNYQEEQTDLIKPYFPFFKCRIESSNRTEKIQSQFRLRNQRFKLNYRIIEQNMGKGDRADIGNQFF